MNSYSIQYRNMKRGMLLLAIVFLLFQGCSKTNEPLPGKEGKIIVLMYHRITKEEASNLYERSAADFESDLIYLISNNISVINFSDLQKIKESGIMPEGHSAIICFDDGDHSWYVTAMPLLKKYRMNATFFLWVNMIGRNSFLSWQDVMFMSSITVPGGIKPFTFGSHSFSHQYLLERKAGFASMAEYNTFLDYELGTSKSLIENYTRREVAIFALPYGDGAGDPDITAAARRNGYNFIRTSRNGVIESPDFDLFNIPSLPMLDNTDQAEIGNKLNR
jgi:peptidoglycan/xylan/chitin deacetylase (PgdA/CDA1 family)